MPARQDVELDAVAVQLGPDLVPGDGRGRSARAAGGSLEGGLLEFEEFCSSLRRSRSFSSSKAATRWVSASTVARAAASCRSSRSMRSSANATHTLDHNRISESIPHAAVRREQIRTPPPERLRGRRLSGLLEKTAGASNPAGAEPRSTPPRFLVTVESERSRPGGPLVLQYASVTQD